MIFYPEAGVNPFAELVAVGCFTWEGKTAYGAAIVTEDGTLIISGLPDHDVDRLVPGILGRVRVTIEPIESDAEAPEIRDGA